MQTYSTYSLFPIFYSFSLLLLFFPFLDRIKGWLTGGSPRVNLDVVFVSQFSDYYIYGSYEVSKGQASSFIMKTENTFIVLV
jgi:hypothetical protein